MEIYALDHVQLAMPPGQEERARAFYLDVLGLKPATPTNTKQGSVWFTGGTLKLHLGVEQEFRPALKAHPALLVNGLEELAAKCMAAGYPVKTDDSMKGYKRMYVSDPFGNRIEFLEQVGGKS